MSTYAEVVSHEALLERYAVVTPMAMGYPIRQDTDARSVNRQPVVPTCQLAREVCHLEEWNGCSSSRPRSSGLVEEMVAWIALEADLGFGSVPRTRLMSIASSRILLAFCKCGLQRKPEISFVLLCIMVS